jgi:hypothetical protein
LASRKEESLLHSLTQGTRHLHCLHCHDQIPLPLLIFLSTCRLLCPDQLVLGRGRGTHEPTSRRSRDLNWNSNREDDSSIANKREHHYDQSATNTASRSKYQSSCEVSARGEIHGIYVVVPSHQQRFLHNAPERKEGHLKERATGKAAFILANICQF